VQLEIGEHIIGENVESEGFAVDVSSFDEEIVQIDHPL